MPWIRTLRSERDQRRPPARARPDRPDFANATEFLNVRALARNVGLELLVCTHGRHAGRYELANGGPDRPVAFGYTLREIRAAIFAFTGHGSGWRDEPPRPQQAHAG